MGGSFGLCGHSTQEKKEWQSAEHILNALSKSSLPTCASMLLCHGTENHAVEKQFWEPAAMSVSTAVEGRNCFSPQRQKP